MMLTPKIKSIINSTLADKGMYQSIKENLKDLQNVLGNKAASKETARLVLALLNRDK